MTVRQWTSTVLLATTGLVVPVMARGQMAVSAAPKADSAAPLLTAADTAWAQLERDWKEKRPYPREGLTAQLAWLDTTDWGRRDALVRFVDAYPQDRRWIPKFLSAVGNPPFYFADYEDVTRALTEGGLHRARRDTAARNLWRHRYPALRAAFLASPYITDQDRRRLRLYEIQSDIYDIDRTRSSAGINVRELQNRFLEFAAEFGASGGVSRYANFMVGWHLLRADRKGVVDFVKRAQASPDTVLRAWALSQGALMTAGNAPFPLAGTGVEGQPVDLEQFRGKVVFIDFWGTG